MRILCLLAIAVWTAPAQEGIPATASISGVVVNAATGEPVSRAHVSIVPAPDQRGGSARLRGGMSTGVTAPVQAPAAALLTTDAGEFHFRNLEPGQYMLQVRKAGFFTLAGTALEARTGPPSPPMRLSMNPQTTVSGTVKDADGEPVEGALVALLQSSMQGRRTVWSMVAQVQTDDRGAFRLITSVTGNLVVSAGPNSALLPAGKPGTAYIQTYFPSSVSAAEATPVPLTPGAQVADIAITLRTSPVYPIRGRVIDVDGTPAKSGVVHLAPVTGEPSPLRTGGQILEDGTFELAGIPPGAYRVLAQVFDPKSPRAAAAEATIATAGIENLELRIPKPVSVKGRVDIPMPPMAQGGPTDIVPVEGMNFKPQVRIGLNPVIWDGASRSYTIETSDDGTFVLDGVQPGKYEITAGFQYGAYLSSVRVNGKEALGGDIEISAPIDELQVVYKADGGTLTARFTGERPRGENPPILVLLPTEPSLRRMPFLYAFQMSSGREAVIPRLRPGEYFVWIFSGGVRYDRLQDPAFFPKIQPTAKKVRINPDGEHQVETAVTLWP